MLNLFVSLENIFKMTFRMLKLVYKQEALLKKTWKNVYFSDVNDFLNRLGRSNHSQRVMVIKHTQNYH